MKKLSRAAGCAAAIALVWGIAAMFWPLEAANADLPVQVDTALIVAVDISDSVDADRYSLQLEGIALALEDDRVISSILSGPLGGIGFALVEWADTAELTIPWRTIRSRDEAFATAALVRGLRQRAGEYTCVSRMMSYVNDRVLDQIPFQANRTVLDVSGDGVDNCRDPAETKFERDALVDKRVQINGLPIVVAGENDTVGAGAYRAPGFGLSPLGPGTHQTTLDAWYREYVIGGPAGFLIPANGFEDFGRAFRLKFVAEISMSAE